MRLIGIDGNTIDLTLTRDEFILYLDAQKRCIPENADDIIFCKFTVQDINLLEEAKRRQEKKKNEPQDLQAGIGDGYAWNVVETSKWRAEHGEPYLTVISRSDGKLLVFEAQEQFTDADKARYDRGNYFQTEGEANTFLNTLTMKIV